MSARGYRRALTLLMVGLLVFAGVAPGIGSALTDTTASEVPPSKAFAAGEPSVELLTKTINDDTETTIEVAYDPGSYDVDDLELAVRGPKTNQHRDFGLFLESSANDSYGFDGKLSQAGGTLTATFPSGTFGGGEVLLTATLSQQDPYDNLDVDQQTISVPTTVELSNPSISPTEVAYGEPITMSGTLTNTGDSPDSFVMTGQTATNVWNSTFVTLDAGETRRVSLTASWSHPMLTEVTVSGQGATMVSVSSPIQLTDRSVNRTSVYAGEPIELSATLENTGSESATERLSFQFGTYYNDTEVTVSAGETTTVTRVVTATDIGRTTPVVSNERLPDVTVESRLTTTGVAVNTSTIDIGGTIAVSPTLSNPSSSWANETVEVSVGGDTVTKGITVAPQSAVTPTLDVTPDSAGDHTVRVNGERSNTRVTIDGVLEIVDGSVSITPSNIETGDSVTVEYTYRNPSDSDYTVDRRIFVYAAGHGTGVDVSLAPGETQDVSVRLTPTRAEETVTVQAGEHDLGTLSVVSPVVIEDVQFDHEVAMGESVPVEVTLRNTDKTAEQTRELRISGNTNAGDDVYTTQSASVPAGATKTVTLTLQPPAPGDYWVRLPNDRESGLAVLEDTAGTAELTFEFSDTKSVSVRNEARFSASLNNTGDADGSKLITLQRTPDGPVIESDVILAEAGEESYGSVAMEFDTPGEKTVYLNGEPYNLTVTEPYILDSSVSVVEGTVPDRMPVLEGGYDRGQLNIEFRINERRASSYDLSRIGADKSTRFKVELTVRDFDPKTVIANGRDVDWHAENLSDGRTKLTLFINPVDLSLLEDTPDIGEWGDTNRTATFTIENSAEFRVYGVSPDNNRSYGWADGMAISTNALQFSQPYYYETANGSRFDVIVAAPHFKEDGSLNTGTYTAHIPQSTLDAWGVDSVDDLEAAYTGGNDTSIDIVDTTEGMTVRLDLHYSSGTVSVGEIGAMETGDTSDGSGDDTGSTDGADGSDDSTSGDTGGSSPAPAPAPGGSDNSSEETSDDLDSQSPAPVDNTTEPPATETPEAEPETATPTATPTASPTVTATETPATAVPTTAGTPAATTEISTPAVTAPATTAEVTAASSTTSSGTGPGFGVILALVALVATLALVTRRD